MSRELKFRVWGKNIKEFLTVNGVEPLDFTLGELTKGYIDDYKQWEFDQYTGLKDKNGKEIYEGDIVACCDFNFLILWRSYDSSFIMQDDEDNIVLPLYANIANEIEVIGNKHEDSYLLEYDDYTRR